MEQKIKCVLFDVGGILVPEKSKMIEKVISELISIPPKETKKIIEKIRPRAYKGEINLYEMYSRLVRKIKSNIDPVELLKRHLYIYRKYSMKINSGIVSLIEDLKKQLLVTCLTNTEPEIAKINKSVGLFKIFDEAFLSCEIRMRKPTLKVYRQVSRFLALKPSEILFIDDNIEYIENAQKVGMNTIYFTGEKALRKKIAKILLAVNGTKL